jgi:hypothetical protein
VPKFTVCALMYGDFPHRAERCLRPLRPLMDAGLIELRVGCNAVSDRTMEVVMSMAPHGQNAAFHVVNHAENILKYPMMRRLFGLEGGLPRIELTNRVMWFDDDSYIKDPDPARWLDRVEEKMQGADMIGSLYRIGLTHSQRKWIADQPWFTGKPIPNVATFATGGWWVLPAPIVYQYNWPVPELKHRGGDVMLGQLCLQNGLRLVKFNEGVAINADAEGRESKSPRRGYDEDPIGVRYDPK